MLAARPLATGAVAGFDVTGEIRRVGDEMHLADKSWAEAERLEEQAKNRPYELEFRVADMAADQCGWEPPVAVLGRARTAFLAQAAECATNAAAGLAALARAAGACRAVGVRPACPAIATIYMLDVARASPAGWAELQPAGSDAMARVLRWHGIWPSADWGRVVLVDGICRCPGRRAPGATAAEVDAFAGQTVDLRRVADV
jgi:hypothetical protein